MDLDFTFDFDLNGDLEDLINHKDLQNFDPALLDSDLIMNTDIDKIGIEGIQAQDVNSLLEQFEEASLFDGFNFSTGVVNASSKSLPVSRVCSATNSPCNTPPPTPPPSVLDKIRNRQEQIKSRTSTIMLPMGAPSKRGRGRGSTFAQTPLNSPSSRLQRILSRAESFPALPVSHVNIQPKSGQSALNKFQSAAVPVAQGDMPAALRVCCSPKRLQVPQPLVLHASPCGENNVPSSCNLVNTTVVAIKNQPADRSRSKLYSQKRITTVMTRAEGIPAEVLNSVMDHDYCANSPRRVIVDEFELATSPTKLKHGNLKSLHKVQSLPALKLEEGRQTLSISVQHQPVGQCIAGSQRTLVHTDASRCQKVAGMQDLPVLHQTGHINMVPSHAASRSSEGEEPCKNSAQMLLMLVNKTLDLKGKVEDSHIALAEEKTGSLDNIQHSIMKYDSLGNLESNDAGKEQLTKDNVKITSSFTHSGEILSEHSSLDVRFEAKDKELEISGVGCKAERDIFSVPGSSSAAIHHTKTVDRMQVSTVPSHEEVAHHYNTFPKVTAVVDATHFESQSDDPPKLLETVLKNEHDFDPSLISSSISDASTQEGYKQHEETACSNISVNTVKDRHWGKEVNKKMQAEDIKLSALELGKKRIRGGRNVYSSRGGKQTCISLQEKNWKPGDSPIREDTSKLFDKIPSYYTALVIPTKSGRKELTAEGLAGNGLSVSDLIPADHSPSHNDTSEYSKLPAYHSCFTNSTKYDGDLTTDEQCPRTGARSRSCSPDHSQARSENRKRSHERDGSSSSSSSRSQSLSRSCKRKRHRSSSSASSSWSSGSRSRSSSASSSRTGSPSSYSTRSDIQKNRIARKMQRQREKIKKMEERKIVYVGKIPDGYTRRELRRRFERFGKIEEVSVHFREGRDNYGFVTFYYSCDAYGAIDKGNSDPSEQHFDLCFGGRRHFCANDYADLDGNHVLEEEYAPMLSKEPVGFDELLKQAKQKLKNKP